MTEWERLWSSYIQTKIWDQIKSGLDWFACEKDEVLQPRLQSATNMARDREDFMRRYMTTLFSEFIKSEQEKRQK